MQLCMLLKMKVICSVGEPSAVCRGITPFKWRGNSENVPNWEEQQVYT